MHWVFCIGLVIGKTRGLSRGHHWDAGGSVFSSERGGEVIV